MVKWVEEEEDDMFDVLQAKDVLCNDTPTHLIKDGTKCQGRFCGKFYPVIVMGTGANSVIVDVYTCKRFSCAYR